MTHQLSPTRTEKISSLLTKIVLGDVNTVETAANSLTQQRLWNEAINLAFKWRVLPALQRQLNAVGIQLDIEIKQQLNTLAKTVTLQSTIAAYKSAILLQKLYSTGIKAAAFKGIGLISNLYEKPGDRMVIDVDILVAEQDVNRACETLSELGYTVKFPIVDFSGTVNSYIQYWQQIYKYKLLRTTNLSICLVDKTGFEIDLHWQMRFTSSEEMTTKKLISRAELVNLFGMEILVLAPEDAIAIAVHHSLRNNLRPSTTLKDLYDLKTWWKVQHQRWQINTVIQQVECLKFSKSLLAMWQILAIYDQTIPVQAGILALKNSLSNQADQQTKQVIELFHIQIDEGEFSQNLSFVLNFSSLKFFLLKKIPKIVPDKLRYERIPRKTKYREQITDLIKSIIGLTPRKILAWITLIKLHKDIGLL